MKLAAAVLGLLFPTVALGAAEAKVSYAGHQVLRFVPDSMEQVRALQALAGLDIFDFWMEPRAVGVPVDARCSPLTCPALRLELEVLGVTNARVMIHDVEELARATQPVSSAAAFNYSEYHTLDETVSWMKSLADQYADMCELVEVGTSYNGNTIYAIKVTGGDAATEAKPAFWMDGGLHAREWITTATVSYMLGTTLEGLAAGDADAVALTKAFTLYFAPILNPDGYEYTWDSDRMWRKTRMPTKLNACIGTDPNRNWDYEWGVAGSSTFPCSDSYQGAAAADQPEVAAVQDFIRTQDDFKIYINFHSYSQLWMSPWGYTSDLPPDYDTQEAGSKAAVDALEAVYGTKYTYGPISTTIYPAAGSSADYTYAVCNTTWSYGVELRDTGKYGFLLPADQIIPSGVETLAGVQALASYVDSQL